MPSGIVPISNSAGIVLHGKMADCGAGQAALPAR